MTGKYNKPRRKRILVISSLYEFLAPRACTAIIFGALSCTLMVKLFHAISNYMMDQYFDWIIKDLIFFLILEFALVYTCFRWPKKNLTRFATIIAAVICTWSVMNAGWLVATGTQILPSNLWSAFKDPVNRMLIVGHHLILRPQVAVALLLPSAIALTFFFTVLANPPYIKRPRKAFLSRIIIYTIVILSVVGISTAKATNTSGKITSKGMRYNCQLKALTSLFLSNKPRIPTRKFPAYDQVDIALKRPPEKPYNVVFVILEGVGYKHTSLFDKASNRTPYLLDIAKNGVTVTNTRPPVTHSTKSFFAILTGRLPSISSDYVEALPADKAYASIVTILKAKLNYRSAFFQSAKGNFECRPGFVFNLGYDKFWTREYNRDPESYLGYLSSDEFKMIDPITEWIQKEQGPFILTVLLSATHDPYEVPQWFGKNEGEKIDKYNRTITYTDSFIRKFDQKLTDLGLAENTLLCIIGDHGEAFGEHQRWAHDRIPFDEALRVVWLLRAPKLVPADLRIDQPACTVDVTPTILSLLGFDINTGGFDGIDILNNRTPRKIFFSGWVDGTTAGYIEGTKKYVHDPTNEMVVVYDLAKDPNEMNGLEITGLPAERVIADVTNWEQNNFVKKYDWANIHQTIIFDLWQVYRLNTREPSAKFLGDENPIESK